MKTLVGLFVGTFAFTVIATIYIAGYGKDAEFQSTKWAAQKVPHKVSACDASLWNHVYTGDPRKFSTPEDRLKVIKDCVTVTGVIESAKAEADGDFHIRLKLDDAFASMLNAKNMSGQHGDLVLEPVCANKVTQRDTLKEGVCDGFSQTIYKKTMLGEHVEVVGVYVTDMEHGWNELHPVTSITVK